MIEADHLNVRAGNFRLHDIQLEIQRGAWAIVLGAAGSGKTTLLETIAGIRSATTGRVLLRGADVTNLPPEKRNVGMVYQQSMLFPHLSVQQNVAYGVREAAKASSMIALFGIEALLERRVHSLSGGERQLVALARTLAPEPDIVLLDEPFSALDPRRRTQARSALRSLIRERGSTVIQVTHDFAEAGLLGDMVAVMHDGRIVQSGSVDAVFHAPASPVVADFIGAENVFSGMIVPLEGGDERAIRTHGFAGRALELTGVGVHAGGPGHVVIRGENVTLARQASESSARNTLQGTIEEITGDGVLARVSVKVGQETLIAIVTRSAVSEMALDEGQSISASIKATAVHVC